jgi:hypothetical protein
MSSNISIMFPFTGFAKHFGYDWEGDFTILKLLSLCSSLVARPNIYISFHIDNLEC